MYEAEAAGDPDAGVGQPTQCSEQCLPQAALPAAVAPQVLQWDPFTCSSVNPLPVDLAPPPYSGRTPGPSRNHDLCNPGSSTTVHDTCAVHLIFLLCFNWTSHKLWHIVLFIEPSLCVALLQLPVNQMFLFSKQSMGGIRGIKNSTHQIEK